MSNSRAKGFIQSYICILFRLFDYILPTSSAQFMGLQYQSYNPPFFFAYSLFPHFFASNLQQRMVETLLTAFSGLRYFKEPVPKTREDMRFTAFRFTFEK